MISIVLIDDHPLAINGIGAWLCGTGRFSIAGTAGTLAEAQSLLERLESLPEIVILDVSLGTEDGLEFVPVLKEICAKRTVVMPSILVCSMYEDPFLIQRAMDSGAAAYVSKSAEAGEIIAAIDVILAGNTYVNPKYELQSKKHASSILTRRENEIVSLVKQSLSNRQIAKRLGISARTVENHLAHIYIKTDAGSREELFEL
ncbi:MAG: response regulator transcription factor [Treponema sp.]|jgi:NarL family two-component system response regulator LiaR|nr:response regulator transcription factor [Treponema sp.]